MPQTTTPPMPPCGPSTASSTPGTAQDPAGSDANGSTGASEPGEAADTTTSAATPAGQAAQAPSDPNNTNNIAVGVRVFSQAVVGPRVNTGGVLAPSSTTEPDGLLLAGAGLLTLGVAVSAALVWAPRRESAQAR
ncbi:MAG TPA: hypothetical protein VFQ96_03730 [Microbacteriaceae bacterium]|nr:hypothetical protein [Microbacteriaceae bacterium]